MRIEASTWRRVHAAATVIWFLAVIPTVLWWSQSVLWVGLMSCYAAAVGHFSAWQAVRAEEKQESSS